ncbi:MAG: arylsulfatase [Rhodospirillales bacterium]|nr:arylsulfatase [Rhodospirillales bacterium]
MKRTPVYILIIAAFASVAIAQQPSGKSVDRSILPPPPVEFGGQIGQTYKDSTPDWTPALPLAAPEGAPNVVVILLDDVGFGHLGCYGGPIETLNIDKLAASGLRFNNFHTTALCSPSRGALLTGRNHHAIGLAAITEAATGFPGNYGSIPKSAATIAETLKQNGYSTMAIGKWHLAPYTAYTAAGPFDRWPLGMGFDKFYGFLGGETDQWAPLLVQDNRFIETPRRPGYHLTEDLVDQAIANIRDQQQANTGRPFFVYLALGANHAPLHAPKEFIDKYRGRFDQGWDKVREETFERQKKLGIIPQNTKLTPRDPLIKPWSELNDTQKRVYARLQETFAGMLDHADDHLGRLFAALDGLGVRDNTIIVLVSDNGASQEGLQDGVTNTDRYRNFNPETVEEMVKVLDKIGSAETDPLYPMGWSLAGNTPFKKWKQDTHSGGNTDPFIVSWPARIKDGGQIRGQYHHLVDVVPTLLEAARLPAPKSVNGVAQMPLAGVSMAYTFTEPNAPTRKKVQYFEMLGSRAIWADGWTAVAWHKPGTSWDQDRWELYHTDVDFAQYDDLAAKNPAKLKAMIALWEAEAKKNNVFPLDDRRYERAADPSRPVAALARKSYTFYPGTSVLHPLAAPKLDGQAHTVTAYVDIPKDGAEGVLASFGGEFGGWALLVKDGKLRYVHNYLKIEEYEVVSNKPVPPGARALGARYVPTGSNLRPDFFTGDVVITIDGEPVGERKGIRTAAQYSTMTGYGLTIGRNIGTPVSHGYQAPFPFTGRLDKVTVDLK